jgi:hypothetical protein
MAISAVAAVFFLIGGLHIAAEISTINFGFFAFPADNAALHFLCHRFAQLVQQVCSDVLSGVSCGNGIGGGSVGGDLAAGPMYRFRVPELFLGCFLTVAVFAAGMLFVRWPYASNPAQAVKQQEASEQGSKAQRPDSELTGSTWLTKDAAGFFAFVLVRRYLAHSLCGQLITSSAPIPSQPMS